MSMVIVILMICILNAFKYVWRAKKKNGVEDIKKAILYLNKYIELEGEREDDNSRNDK